MNEVHRPKKPLIFYYAIVLVILLLFNVLAMPYLMEGQIQQVDYGTFMSMTENGEIGQVEIQDQSQPDSLHQQGQHQDLQNRDGGRPRPHPEAL